MSLKWDGSYYGKVKKKDIILSIKEGVYNIKLIKLGKSEEWCYIKKTDDDFVCFYDEVKPIFGLIKQGTYRIKINNINYIICRYRNLKKVKIKDYEKYSDDISKILIYKRLFSVSESLRDIYYLKGRILDLSFGKFICHNKMRSIFLKRFFRKAKVFEEILFYEMIGKTYENKIECMSKIDNKISKKTSHILYSSIGSENLAQNISDYREILI